MICPEDGQPCTYDHSRECFNRCLPTPKVIDVLQEEPAGKPWESDEVRTWEPRPFDPVEYAIYANQVARDAVIDHA